MSQENLLQMSKITPEYQTILPQKIRDFLNIESGDLIAFEIKEGAVILKKITSVDQEYLAAVSDTLNEWLSPEDEEAYNDL